MTTRLPIEDSLPDLLATLESSRNAVLQAPPGAGKSTRVPLALLDAPWIQGRKIVMLEPRRLAARAVAARMAFTLRESAGQTIGYRTRLESRTSASTRIEVVTEGILTRWLQRDPALEDVAIVIFDEFHERSLQADLGLALTLDAQATVREDLRILVMSATLDGQAVARLLGDAPIVTSSGRAFAVETYYREPLGRVTRAPERPLPEIVAATVANALAAEPGDALVFLPGQADIQRTLRLLQDRDLPRGTRVLPLYGDLPIEQQDEAIKPSASGTRKVVLATNIAETSLTIEGVRIVVDSGLERRMRFNPPTGMSRLETTRISRASADQRRGRAGRLEAGVCYRLWSESEHAALAAQTPAEIMEADLAPLALELASWGVADPSALQWLDPPPSAAFAQARDLLRSLEALDAHGRIIEHGRAMAALGTHPRLAHMIVRSVELRNAQLALEIAALLGERDVLRGTEGRGTTRDIDLRLRIEALRDRRQLPPGLSVDSAARQRVLRTIDQLARQLRAKPNDGDDIDHDTGSLLALAYPDRIAMSRGGSGRYVLSSGRGALLVGTHSLAQAEFLVVADLDAGEREATIRLAAPIDRSALERSFAGAIETRERVEWDSREQAVLAQRERWLGALKLSEQRLDRPDTTLLTTAMLNGVREIGLAQLPWSKDARALQARMEFARRVDPKAQPQWPAVSDDALLASLDEWLAPWLDGVTRRDHLARLDLHTALFARLNWNQQQRLNEIAPTHLAVPSGSRIPIDYSGATPAVSVRLQELFGMRTTPTIGVGNVPLTLNLLSPAHRPVQVTQDLVSFWARGYPEVKKELKGRYPKHYWPDDPLTALPTARAKPRGT